MAKRNLSQTEINARKKVQAGAWRAGGVLGLAGTGTFLASKAPGSARVVRAIPKAKKLNAKKLESATIGIGATGGGLAGVSSFNSASISAAEARQRKKTIVKKSAFGVEHIEVAKADEYVRGTKAKIKRTGKAGVKRQEGINAVGGTALGGGWAAMNIGARELRSAKRLKQSGLHETAIKTAKAGGKFYRSGKKAAIGGAATLVGGTAANIAYTTNKANRQARAGGLPDRHAAKKPIAKNYVSPFGITH